MRAPRFLTVSLSRQLLGPIFLPLAALGRSTGSILVAPKSWFESSGEMFGFAFRVVLEVLRLRVFKFFGEVLWQAGILIVSSRS